MTTVRAATTADADPWLELRRALWPDSSLIEHREEIGRFFDGALPSESWEVLLAEDDDGRVVGFAELSIRSYAEGCRTQRVAYLEGWFVRADVRGLGVGGALVAASEDWGRTQGCEEFASDSEPDNDLSRSAHRAVGFSEVGLVRCFKKDL